jgi:hypothetical protein
MTAQEKILAKALVTTGLSSAEIDGVRAGFKDRAFFSARIESVRDLQVKQQQVADWLGSVKREDGALTTRASAISAIMASAKREGIATGTGKVSDPGSVARAQVVVDTNADLARGYVSHVQQSSTGSRLAFPAQELIRIEERQAKRDWTSKWTSNGGKLYGVRMIALKEDPVWTKISRFGVPYPPFDYGSGMGVEEVDYDTCIELGVITESYKPEGDIIKDFNATLEADMDFSGKTEADRKAFAFMTDSFGDQVWLDNKTGKLKWNADIVSELLKDSEAAKSTSIRLGKPTPQAMYAANEIGEDISGKALTMPGTMGKHEFKKHYGAAEKEPSNVPLTEADMRLLPNIWRFPDKIRKSEKGGLYIEQQSSDGNWHRIVVSNTSQYLRFDTYYKVKANPATGLPIRD